MIIILKFKKIISNLLLKLTRWIFSMKRAFIIFLQLWLNSYNQASNENSNLLIPRLVLYTNYSTTFTVFFLK